jgi:hypothetical protein
MLDAAASVKRSDLKLDSFKLRIFSLDNARNHISISQLFHNVDLAVSINLRIFILFLK